jgi:glycosyltransferase involved in cell wall biosynthesis
VRILAEGIGSLGKTRIIGLNQRGRIFGREGRAQFFPAALALVAPLLIRLTRSGRCVNHVFASAGERFLIPRMDPGRTVLTISKTPPAMDVIERNLPVLRRLRHVVVESERDRELLRQGGVSEESLKLIYPGAVERPYRSASDPFTILFATSPIHGPALLQRGVRLMVRVAKALPEIRFLLVWRNHHLDLINGLINDAGVNNVEVRNGVIKDMAAVYDSVHATILPGLDYGALKPSPQSGLDSLAHGKPVLISKPTSIAGVVARNRCGVVFEPAVEDLREAILHLRDNYALYQANCHSTIENNFSPRVFLERYRRIYTSMQ